MQIHISHTEVKKNENTTSYTTQHASTVNKQSLLKSLTKSWLIAQDNTGQISRLSMIPLEDLPGTIIGLFLSIL